MSGTPVRNQKTSAQGPGVTPRFNLIDGLREPCEFRPDNILGAMNYKPRNDDVFIVTYPKCGTTWTQYIVSLIFRKGRPFKDKMDFHRSTPFFERWGKDYIDKMDRPGAIKIHLPVSHMRHWSNEAKYIYVTRNPKDCLVSLYYHTKMFDMYEFQDGKFDDFFEAFINGEMEDNDYFDHLIGWYEKRSEPNVLFLTYEEMKADTTKSVMDIAEFLGPSYAQSLKEEPQYLSDVLRYSSFDYMKDHDNEHCRKGVVGDWKGHLTSEQAERLDQKFQMRGKGSDVLKLWL